MDNFDEQLKKHYENRSLSDTRVEEILHSCQDARHAYRWKRVAVGAMAVAAASVVALGVTLVSVRPGNALSPSLVNLAAVPPAERLMEPKLYAVRIHADRCARSQSMAPIFASLQQEFEDAPVFFVTFDYSSKSALHQTQCLSRLLGIETVFKACRKTGALVLATPEGDVRDVIDTDGGLLAVTESVRHCLEADVMHPMH